MKLLSELETVASGVLENSNREHTRKVGKVAEQGRGLEKSVLEVAARSRRHHSVGKSVQSTRCRFLESKITTFSTGNWHITKSRKSREKVGKVGSQLTTNMPTLVVTCRLKFVLSYMKLYIEKHC